MDFKKWAIFGGITGLAAYGTAQLITLLKIPVLEWGLKAGSNSVGGTFATIDLPVRDQILSQGAMPAAGQWFMNLFNGSINLGSQLNTILSLVIGGIILIGLSAFVLGMVPAVKRLSGWKELLAVFSGAAVIGGVLFMGMTSLAFATSLVVMIIYFALIAGLIVLVNKFTGMPQIPQL